MPRTARVAPGEMPFHVVSRGVGRMRLFVKDADGEDFTLSYHVRDVGISPNPFNSGFDVAVYRSDDMFFDASEDTLLMTDPLTSAPTSAGAHTVTFPAASSFPDDADEDYYLIAMIDASEDHDEAHEQNNALVFQGGAFVVDTGASRTLHVHGTEGAGTQRGRDSFSRGEWVGRARACSRAKKVPSLWCTSPSRCRSCCGYGKASSDGSRMTAQRRRTALPEIQKPDLATPRRPCGSPAWSHV